MPIDPPAPFHPTATRRIRSTVRVGVGVVVVNHENRIYAGIRNGETAHGRGKLALPGGHLELYESWEECACREVMEEMGIPLDKANVHFLHVTNDIMEDEEKHYCTIFMMVRLPSTTVIEPQNLEPEKCEGWDSYSWEEMLAMDEHKLFLPLFHLVRDNPDKLQMFLEQY